MFRRLVFIFLFIVQVCAQQAVAESLSERLKVLEESSQRIAACEVKNKALREKIASKVDDHYKGRLELLESQFIKQTKKRFVPYQLGNLTLLVRKVQKPVIKTSLEWEKVPESWSQIQKDLRWYRFLTRNWLFIYADTSSVLVNDESRRVYPQMTVVPPNQIQPAKVAFEEIIRCRGKSGCAIFNFTDADKKLMESIPILRTLYEAYQYALANGEKFPNGTTYPIEQMRELEEGFREVFPGILPQTKDAITRPERNTLLVKMDAGDLKGYEKELEKVLAVWSQFGFKVKIEWVDQTTEPEAVKFIMDLNTGDRAYMNGNIHLPKVAKDTTIIHEFGHVLGLPDEYYTYFFENECEYKNLYHHGNIMSYASTGYVLESHIKTLRAMYFAGYSD